MGSVDQTASRMARLGDAGGGTAYLLVVDNDTSTIFHLPHTGAIVVGRAPEADLRVQHASVSRRHATFRAEQGVIRVADLGSHNGTRVNGELVADSRTLASGDVVTVGDVVLVVHFSQPAEVARQTYPEAGWRRRLVEELERAISAKRSLAVVAILAEDRAAFAALASKSRLVDVIGHADDGTALLLMPEVDRERARQIAQAVIDDAGAIKPTRAGLAMCPADAVDPDTILLAARTAARRAQPGEIADAADTVTRIELGSRHVLAAAPAMIRVFALIERLASSQLPVLILGETGVGKENAAYAVHHWSRRTGPFIAVNCASIGPESLVDSELFGYEKGAFTGATTAKAGLFEAAAGGTIFLDELKELPLAVQAKLLRALETRKITRLGDTKERPIDIRLVAATQPVLDQMVASGTFREDLYFRLAGARVILPPLRDRRCEIPLLARAFLADLCAEAGRPAMTISPAAMQVLLTCEWKGNVRQLRSTMERAMVNAPDQTIEVADLPPEVFPEDAPPPTPTPAASPARSTTAGFRPISEELEELEKRRMIEALSAAGGVKTKAAQLIDMPIRTFTHKLKQYGL